MRLSFHIVLIAFLISAAPSFAGRFDTRSPDTLFEDCVGKLIRTAVKQAHRVEALFFGSDQADERRIARLDLYPRRRLERSDQISKFLETHPVYISVTTTPSRIGSLAKVLLSLDTAHVAEVLVILPDRFGRDGSRYDVPKELLKVPKVRVLRTKYDLGPATKLLPAALWLSGRRDEPLLITIDDDNIYPAGMVNELIAASAQNPNSAIGGAGGPLGLWNLKGIKSEAARDYFWSDDIALRRVDVLEGFAAVAYPVKMIPIKTILDWVGLSDDCRNSDDLLISMALRATGVARFQMRSRFYSRDYLYPLAIGFGEDALHRGAGIVGPVGGGGLVNSNQSKYQRAFASLIEAGGLK